MAVNSQVPGPSIVPFSLPMSLRGAPNPQSSSCAGDGASSRLDSRILQRLCKRSSGLPRLLASPVPPPDESPGCPESYILRPAGDGASSFLDSRILQRLRERSFRFPRLLASPAPPPMWLRVAPSPASSGLPTVSPRVAPNPLLPAWPGAQPPGCPGCRAFWLALGSVSGLPRILLPWPRQRMDLRVAPNPAPSSDAVSASSGRPDCCVYGWAAPRLRVSPNPASAAGPMLTPRLNSNLASSTLGRG